MLRQDLSQRGVRRRGDDGRRPACDSCGAVEAVGAIHVYMAAGTVLRCPALRSRRDEVVTDGERIWYGPARPAHSGARLLAGASLQSFVDGAAPLAAGMRTSSSGCAGTEERSWS